MGSPFLADRERSLPVRAREQAVPQKPRDQGPLRHDFPPWLSREARPRAQIPDRRKTPPAGDRLRGRHLLSGTTFLFCCIFVCSLFPEFQPVNRHTCGANSSLCIAVAGLSPGIRPVGAGLCPPTWVAGANSSATEVSPEPSPAGHRDGSMWGRDATGPEPTPAPRWSRPPQTKPHAPNPSPQPSPYKVMRGREPIRLSRGVFLASSQ
jgi:hypothetical protein